MPPKRYFEDLADNVRPGVISQALREAIGLDDDKLPIWIYRMRVLGYPPGWMRVADMSGTVVPLLEEAEQTDTHSDRDKTYNIESLVVYPGFNSPVPSGVGDDYRLLRMPPLMNHQQLDFATSTMKTPKPIPYKRIKISSPESQNLTHESDGEEGPTTTELLKMVEARDTRADEVSPAVRLIKVGVGVPESYKTKKPPLEKWSENNSLSELIYFENLPNYTGVFDKMRTVLGGVRNRLFGPSSTKVGEDTASPEDQTPATRDPAADTPVTSLEENEVLAVITDDDDVIDAGEREESKGTESTTGENIL